MGSPCSTSNLFQLVTMLKCTSVSLLVIFASLIIQCLSDCECSKKTTTDENSGKEIGDCKTTLKGKSWCYVSSDSTCTDKEESKRESGSFFSKEACNIKKEQEKKRNLDDYDDDDYDYYEDIMKMMKMKIVLVQISQ